MDYFQRMSQTIIKAMRVLEAKNIPYETIGFCPKSDNENTIYVDDKEFGIYDDRVDNITMFNLEFFQNLN